MTKASKQPIALREKKLKDGRISLYLDSYVAGTRGHSYEFLRLYLVPERTKADKAQNKQTIEIAKAIQAQRILERARGQAGLSRQEAQKVRLMDYIECLAERQKEQKIAQSTIRHLITARRYIAKCVPKNITLNMIDKATCVQVVNFLANCGLSKGTAKLYFVKFSFVLNCAVKDGLLLSNPAKMLTRDEKKGISYNGAHRDYLTEEELSKLVKTECDDTVKRAFIFACFTGLRISDIYNLSWNDIINDTQGNKVLNITMRKVDEEVYIPLNKKALSWLPVRLDKDDKVFRLPGRRAVWNKLHDWAERAGIQNKRVSFHTSRHTFATLLLTHGADLYTTSKLLGHKDIKTTQVYADIVDKKKNSVISLLDKIDFE